MSENGPLLDCKSVYSGSIPLPASNPLTGNSVVSIARERGVTAGGQAEAGLEMPSHVALVGKAYSVGGVGKRGAARDLGPHVLEATADEVAVRRGAEPVAEATGEGVAVEAGLLLQRRAGDGASGGVEEAARGIEGFLGQTPRDRGRTGPAREGVRERGN